MEDGSMIKITRELIHDMLGIPMGDIKVKSLKENNLLDPVTAKWRGMADWLFDIGFLSLFFSIFGQGNKDGTINERLIPYLDETDKIHLMDWCSNVLESLVKECTGFSASDKFNGPLLLLAEMEEILKDNLLKGRKLMEDTDNKLDISLAVNSDDEELKNIIEKRNELFVTLFKDVNKKVEEDDEDKDMDLEKDDDDEETLQHLPYSPETNPGYPGRLVAGDTFLERHVARDKWNGKARMGFLPGRHSRVTFPGDIAGPT
ncbi:hypothetical protein Tco_0765681 [Tanacetum coccineum]